MKLEGRLVPVAEVTSAQRDLMFALMDRHYENVERSVFEADLDEKQWVIQVWHPRSRELWGFSTQMLLEATVFGRHVTALFSGDTIIDRGHWGDTALMHAAGRLVLTLIDERPGTELYWFLISKGYKTYRFLPVFFREFYPHPERATPAVVQAVVDALAGNKYPRDYDANCGIIRAAAGHNHLRSGVADITPDRLLDPFVRFFDERNPGHARGDELCCLAPLTRENLTSTAYRVINAKSAVVGGTNMSLAGVLNTAWMLNSSREARAFRRAIRRVSTTQSEILRAILRQNADTEFGRAHGFRDVADARAYQERVPLTRHEDLAGAIERIAAGRERVLTAEPVRLLEPTSGTTGAQKLIPYTDSLRRQFQRAVAVWVADLFARRPAARRGRAYWSISPNLGPSRRTAGGIPIGFDEDAAYLGTLEQFALERLLVVPSVVSCLTDMETFRYCTLYRLLQAEDLTLISIWSPTFLPAMLAPLEPWADRLVRDLHDGTLSPPTPLPLEIARRLTKRASRHRAVLLGKVLNGPYSRAEKHRRIWPRLSLLSCWTDAASANWVHELRELFPEVEIQPKGLLATEGCVTIPMVDAIAPALAIRSHFFEFQEVNQAGEPVGCRLAHELESGARYRVILTTGGGLYRYPLRDEVQVAGFLDQCPLLRFLGKADRVSDLVGEKLAEAHVGEVLTRTFAALRIAPRFALLAPAAGRPAHYRLFMQCAGVSIELTSVLRAELEKGLRENPHYGYAVRAGQLAPVEIVRLKDGESAWGIYYRHYLARGLVAGAIKPSALDPWIGWTNEFGSLEENSASAVNPLVPLGG